MIVLTRRVADAETVTGSVTLTVDSRIKSRLRVSLDDGRDAGLMLERGHLLRGGELLADAEGGQVIRVLAAPEAVSTVRCSDPHLLARAAYHLGNRHVPLQIEAGLAALPARPCARRHAAWPGADGGCRTGAVRARGRRLPTQRIATAIAMLTTIPSCACKPFLNTSWS
jgi:urease accessory protein UreE